MAVLCHTFAIIWRYNDYVEKAEDKDVKMLKSICEAMGNRILAFCAASGKLTLLLLATLRRLKDANAKEVVRQMALLGADSLPIVMMTILCTGMVFSVQTAKEFVRLGASSSVGGIVAIAMARELVPVLTGVVVAGRIGAAIAAELGTMKVTEQIDALRVMAANPVSYLVVPRFIALVLMMPVLVVFANFIGNIGYVGVCIIGGILAGSKTITIGDIQAFIQYVKNFSQPITQIAQVINQVQSMAAASERVFEFLEEEEEEQIAANPVPTDNIRGEVEFKHVKFGYKEDQIIIKDFCANVKPGQKVAIVGPTGAGKTTMVKLLMRFYDVNSGEILIDGHNIKDFNRRELRDAFGMVLQDTWLYKDTIMENIRYGKLDATDEEVIAAAKAAHAHHFIETLPGGYNMELNEDASNVSQGQKQLLTIARAILADNPILILDEATSSVDTRTEIQIQNAMDNLMKGRTSFVIAHRLSTIKDADIILVMKEGDIVEQGNHEELLAKGGFYADLYNSQFEEAEAS